MSVGIINTGCANIFSVQAALNRLSVEHRLMDHPGEASSAERLILPGVGSARPAMAALRDKGWADALAGETRPVLGICLGMQLLFEHSLEDETDCLGLIPGLVERLPECGQVLPHMGWNSLSLDQPESGLLSGIKENDRVYFVHSFCAPVSSITIASAAYGKPFSAVVQNRNFFGCQFHPERSSEIGSRIIQNFLEV